MEPAGQASNTQSPLPNDPPFQNYQPLSNDAQNLVHNYQEIIQDHGQVDQNNQGRNQVDHGYLNERSQDGTGRLNNSIDSTSPDVKMNDDDDQHRNQGYLLYVDFENQNENE